MYSYMDENFIMNGCIDSDIYLYNLSRLKGGENIEYIEEFNSFLAALDDYVITNPQKINEVNNLLDKIIKEPEKYLNLGVASQYIETQPNILRRKKIQYQYMSEGKKYEANLQSLVAQEIYLSAAYDVALEMNMDDVIENIEHDKNLIELRKNIEYAEYRSVGNEAWKSKLEELQNEYNNAVSSKQK